MVTETILINAAIFSLIILCGILFAVLMRFSERTESQVTYNRGSDELENSQADDDYFTQVIQNRSNRK